MLFSVTCEFYCNLSNLQFSFLAFLMFSCACCSMKRSYMQQLNDSHCISGCYNKSFLVQVCSSQITISTCFQLAIEFGAGDSQAIAILKSHPIKHDYRPLTTPFFKIISLLNNNI